MNTIKRPMAVILAALILACARASENEPAATVETKPEEARPQVEVVFVLDTTGSMGGLIQAAKEKIWAIANTLATTKPAPKIKMGLVGYRDRGDAYITKRMSLTDDLDSIYTELMGFAAAGGGDGPESVNQALNEAVTQMQWSSDKKTYRVLFLVGDAPPHMDYADDVKFPESCRIAAEKGVIVNTIQCGNQTDTEQVWKEIAAKAEGRYFRVEQSGSAILASTPFDTKLAELALALDKTRIYYGNATQQRELRQRATEMEAAAAAGPTAAKAQRAQYNCSDSGAWNFAGKNELIADVEKGTLNLSELKEDQLPSEMKALNQKEREQLVQQNLKRRAELQEQIRDLSAKRQQHIQAQVKSAGEKAKSSLDVQVYDAIKTQAAKKEIRYESGPSF